MRLPRYSQRLPATLAALAVVAAACGDDGTGPQLQDPGATAAAVEAVDAVFRTPVFASFSTMGDVITPLTPPAPSPLANVAAMLRATAPSALLVPQHSPSLATPRASELRALIPAFSRMANEAVIPPEVRGITFVWDNTTTPPGYVPSTRSGAPADGVRFILYDAATFPTTLTEVGYVDIRDLSTPTVAEVEITVVGTAGPAPVTYALYTVSATATATSFTAAAAGYVTNGQSGAAERRLEFSAQSSVSETATTASASVDVTLALFVGASNVPDVTLAFSQSVEVTASATNISIDFELTRGGETVRIFGTVSVVNATGSTTVDITITVNGRTFATIRGTDAQTQVRGPGGRQLTDAEAEALVRVLLAFEGITEAVEDLFDPVKTLAGA